ncbi:hypothetical protein V6R21_21885 [Limibacter armeniacum]|uniref:hypothetical protein n=1 Tax=Limibacter armeniacum TaxID=466084 RepID=UPI002FE5C4F0
MKHLHFYFLVFIAAIAGGCTNPESTTYQETNYFDIVKLVQSQIDYLESNKATVNKEVWLDGQHETTQVKQVDWQKELTLFVETDLNKPVLRGSYQVEKSSNKTTYSAIEKNLEIQQVDVIRDGDQLKEVRIKLLEDNMLFTFEKNLVMTFDQASHLNSYKVEGLKKVIFLSPSNFTIEGSIAQIP